MTRYTKTGGYLRFCASLLRYKPGITLANVLCNIVIFSYWAVMSFCFREILNHMQITPQGKVLAAALPYLVGMLGVSAVCGAAIMACSYLDRLRSYYYQARTRANLLAGIYRQDDMARVAGHSGKIFEVLDDDVPVSTFPPELLTEVTGFVFFTVTAIVMMLSINWMVTLFIFIPLSLAIFGVQKLSERMKEKRRANREAHDDVSNFIGDVTGAVLSIKGAGAQEAVLRRADENNRARRTRMLDDIRFGAKTETMLKGAVSAGTVIMMVVAASMIPSGRMMIGDFSMFVLHLGTLASCVDRIVELIYESKKAEVSYERILETIGAENEKRLADDAQLTIRPRDASAPDAATVIADRVPLRRFEAVDIAHAYGDGGGLQDVNLRIGPGELVVVTGEIGSGKSTLFGILSGTTRPDSGRLLYNGVATSDVPALHRPPMIVGIPQRAGFFAADVRTNLCLGYPATDAEVSAALRIAVLEETVAAMEHGLDTQIGSRGEALSGGQRQRLALARAFLRSAEITIIDDNISGLDTPTRLCLLDNITAYIRDTRHAVLIATNNAEFMQAASRVIVMENGRIL